MKEGVQSRLKIAKRTAMESNSIAAADCATALRDLAPRENDVRMLRSHYLAPKHTITRRECRSSWAGTAVLTRPSCTTACSLVELQQRSVVRVRPAAKRSSAPSSTGGGRGSERFERTIPCTSRPTLLPMHLSPRCGVHASHLEDDPKAQRVDRP